MAFMQVRVCVCMCYICVCVLIPPVYLCVYGVCVWCIYVFNPLSLTPSLYTPYVPIHTHTHTHRKRS
jgi:hypothetical protein